MAAARLLCEYSMVAGKKQPSREKQEGPDGRRRGKAFLTNRFDCAKLNLTKLNEVSDAPGIMTITMDEENLYAPLRLANQLCFPLYAAARRVTSAYTPFLKPLGLTYTQYIVFMVLWEKREVTVRDLCSELLLDSGTLTPVLKKLEEEGYITRARCADDERVVTVRVTESGMALREKAVDVPRQMASCVALEPGEAAQLHRILYKILS